MEKEENVYQDQYDQKEKDKRLWEISPGRFIDPETGLPPLNSDKPPPSRSRRRIEPPPEKKSPRDKLWERTKSEAEYAASTKDVSEEDRILAAFEDEWKRRKPRQPLTRMWFPAVHHIPNEIVTPNPFGIHSRKEKLGYYEEPLILKYGENIEMRVSGRKLNVKDQDVFIALTEVAKNKGVLEFETSLAQLCGRLGKSYSTESKESVKKSLERLAWAEIKIVDKKGGGSFPT